MVHTGEEDEVEERIWIIYLGRAQNFPKNYHFTPPNMHTFVCESEGKKC